MGISVIQPIGAAFERTALILFKPFDIGKWCILGFCAFLSYLGEGGGGGGPTGQWQQGHGGPGGREITDWVEANIGIILIGGLLMMCVMLGLIALLMWLSSRGKFMFLDGVVRNRAAVVEPWRDYAVLANSLCGARIAVTVLSSVLFLGVLVIAAYVVWPDLRAEQWGERALAGSVFLAVGIIGLGLVFGFIGMLIEDFITPTMYQFALRFLDAWEMVVDEVVRDRMGTILLYFVMKIVLGLGLGLAGFVAVCATCCIAAIPYVGTVILLPLYVFLRCYPLCFLEQLGPDWLFFVDEPPAAEFASPSGGPGGEPGGD